ncbi:alpha-1 2-galactosyltransferase [Fusarium pseudocircinatum]|uniref:Alpha-1 2-galactosyltransferase n=1 Tax=Fusarium pseudocircinatum TaxID=56676 RepID=A0A8H5PHI8_9HYPO|nr:alpha-1 2-galactosyltransferase [Fusarium pseudocircinatum]
MHFAYPPRKNSNPPPFKHRSSQIPPILRRIRKRTALLLLLGAIGLIFFLFGVKGETPYREHVPSGKPPVVVVTVLDTTQYNEAYLESIRHNREQYASRNGYEAMIVGVSDYDTGKSPRSWTKIIAMRHALSKYPDATYIWYLDQNAYIMELDKKLEEQVVNPAKLESLMIKDWSIVPPDSIIKTFSHLKGEDAGLVISQDEVGLVTNSYILKNGEWAKFFIETWMDPLYQSYNFQKAERHALEHIVQWHPTILSKLALIPQRTFASYGRNKEGNAYRDGDFVTLLVDCTVTGPTSCDKQSHFYLQQLKNKFGDASVKKPQ